VEADEGFDMTGVANYSDNLSHIQGALLGLNLRLHRQVLRWRATHHERATSDELAGLLISENEADAILDELYRAKASSDADEVDRAPIATLTGLLERVEEEHVFQEEDALSRGISLRLPELVRRFGLDEFEAQIILLTLAPEFKRVYQRLFKYLNDDVSRPWPSVDLALHLFGNDDRERVRLLRYFNRGARIRQLHLVRLSEETMPLDQPLLSRGLKLEDRVVSYLLEMDAQHPFLGQTVEYREPADSPPVLSADTEQHAKMLRCRLSRGNSPVPAVALIGPDMDTSIELASWISAAIRPGAPLLVVDDHAFTAQDNPEESTDLILREARLKDASLVVRDAGQVFQTPQHGRSLRRLLKANADIPRFLIFRGATEQVTGAELPLVTLDVNTPDFFTRRRLWEMKLNGASHEVDLDELAGRFRLSNSEIAQAANQAFVHSDAFGDGSGPRLSDLFSASRGMSTGAMTGLAQRLESIHVWEDLVLPGAVKSQLLSLEHWVRYRFVVYDTWGFSERVMLGRGLVVLFSGASGTGKTMAAGILARNLELDLYRIDLAQVVSKYIGETEKNLGRIFDAAQSANAVLFFDEADALFGKRSEVKDAHDRYANIEVSYLLQRMESYDGIAILCTNFRQNLDQAFARRLHMVVEFSQPNVGDRERIWRRLLPETVPQDHLDLGFLARQFSLTGGNIKNCVLTAAFQAAAEDSPITMRHVVMAIARELQKTEQPLVRSDFGRYYDVVRGLGTR
jgi:hypothetical protein